MRHEDDNFGAVFAGIFDCWKRSDNALIISDILGGIEGNIEINLLKERY